MATLEVRTFEEDAQVASDFTRKVWLERYQLTSPVIEWSANYYQQFLMWDRPGSRDFLVAAYDGAKLVGTLFAERTLYQLRGQPITGTVGSWLSVDPDSGGKGIGRKLVDEMRRRHREQDAKFMMGYGVIGTDGPKFWRAQKDTVFLGTVGFWVRMFDHRAVAEWSMSARDRLLTRAVGPFFSGPPPAVSSDGVRAWEPRDLEASRQLLAHFETQAALGHRWDEARMKHQLTPAGITRTLVLERGGAVKGLVNYYVIDMTGRGTMPVAVIDYLAIEALDPDERQRLLGTALTEMAAAGAKLAMILRVGCLPGRALWKAGFVPIPEDTYHLATIADPTLDLKGVKPLFLNWR